MYPLSFVERKAQAAGALTRRIIECPQCEEKYVLPYPPSRAQATCSPVCLYSLILGPKVIKPCAPTTGRSIGRSSRRRSSSAQSVPAYYMWREILSPTSGFTKVYGTARLRSRRRRVLLARDCECRGRGSTFGERRDSWLTCFAPFCLTSMRARFPSENTSHVKYCKKSQSKEKARPS